MMKKTEIKINNVKTKPNENAIINFIKSSGGNSTNSNSNKTSNPPSTNGKVKEEVKKIENPLSNNDSINTTKLVGNVESNTVNEDEVKSGVVSRRGEDENFEVVNRLQEIYKKYKGIFDLADADDFEIIIETLKNNLMNEN
jgi:hypothetical protein